MNEEREQRVRTQTEKGEEYSIERHIQSNSSLNRTLKKLSESCLDLIESCSEVGPLKDKHLAWLQVYDNFLESHTVLVGELKGEELNLYLEQHGEREQYFSSIKNKIENYFLLMSTKLADACDKDSKISHNVRPRSSAFSNRSDTSSMYRLKEEQRRAELRARQSQLQKKKELQLLELKVKQQQEELEIETDLAVAEAKLEILSDNNDITSLFSSVKGSYVSIEHVDTQHQVRGEHVNVPVHTDMKHLDIQSQVTNENVSAPVHTDMKHLDMQNQVRSENVSVPVHTDMKHVNMQNQVRSEHVNVPVHTDMKHVYMQNQVRSEHVNVPVHTDMKHVNMQNQVRSEHVNVPVHTDMKRVNMQNQVRSEHVNVPVHTDMKHVNMQNQVRSEHVGVPVQKGVDHAGVLYVDQQIGPQPINKISQACTSSYADMQQVGLPSHRGVSHEGVSSYIGVPQIDLLNQEGVTQHVGFGQLSQPQGAEQSESAVIDSVVKQLRKPVSEIKKFGGSPMEYRRFVRQFQTKVVANTDDYEEKMNYLEQYTYGEAHKVVSGFVHLRGEQAFKAAMRQLEDRYGDEEVIATAFIKKALDWPDVKPGDANSLDEFALFLVECENAVESMEAMRVLEYSENIKKLVSKMPIYFHDRWRNIVLSQRNRHESVKFSHLVHFIQNEAKKARDPVYGNVAMETAQKSKVVKFQRAKDSFSHSKNSFVTGLLDSTDRNKLCDSVDSTHSKVLSFESTGLECSYCQAKNHRLDCCDSMNALSLEERYKFLSSKAFCFGCARKGHRKYNCKNRSVCKVCKGRHPTILHNSSKRENYPDVSRNNSMKVSSSVEICGQTGAGEVSCAMAIIPVRVKLKNKSQTVETYAFFDSGSSVSFCTEDLMYQLGANGKKMQITLNTMGAPQKLQTYSLKGLQVCDLDMCCVVDMPTVYTKDKMPVGREHMATDEEIAQWPHLSDVFIPKLDAKIGLMIGNNVPDAFTPFKVVTGPSRSPHATKTRLGWIVWNLTRAGNFSPVVNRAEAVIIQETENMKQLDQLVRDSINQDFPERRIDDKRENSVEDRKFLKHVENSIYSKGGHYYIALPFREEVHFPNNSYQGLQRLKGLRKRLISHPKFKADYTVFMNKLFEKGYAEPVPRDQINREDGRVWYIPHHGVYHSKKPDKIRVVFDCSATYMGISLNSQLMQGPDLTNSLMGVLMRFREERIAIQGDVESMFYQVNVPEKDRDVLRFYWWPDGDLEKEAKVYRMTVHIFGAVSSPSCSNYALRRTVEDFGSEFDPIAAEVLLKDMYVDDCLTSVDKKQQGVALIEDVGSLCQKGGFHLTKWMSNQPEVLESLPAEELATGMKQWALCDDPPEERALGVHWLVENDSFGFKITQKNQPATKRGILSLVSSVYDPLGIAAPFVLTAKGLLQSLCRSGLGWDEEISGSEFKKWNSWLHELKDLEKLQLKRCYKPESFGEVVSCQLHCFSDASDQGYGMVFYLRLIDCDGRIHCAFLLGKSRVTPLKTITVPRMELTAATGAVKLSKSVIEELDYKIDRVVYWTDSMSVLGYISNETTRFHTFVANRLSIIHEATKVSQWHYVNTKLNPADIATRAVTVDKFIDKPQWLHGPDFLWLPEQEWPHQDTDRNIPEDDTEVKRTVNTAIPSEPTNILQRLLYHCSSWLKLKRITAWWLIYMDNLKASVERRKTLSGTLMVQHGKKKPTPLTRDVLLRAEKKIIEHVQQQHFSEEFKTIQMSQKNPSTKHHLKKSSKLYKLEAFVKDDLLRIGGRLRRADMTYDAKHPIILPKDSPVSKLIIEDIHQSIGHLGRNYILSNLRERYWIIGATVAVKSCLSKCVTCRKLQSPTCVQKMADLPTERLVSDEPPFSRVGMDFFGPFEVKRGRSQVKRYGVIFTCLSIRAVHLEVAFSLNTDSCIDAIRRFIARRGRPKFIRSDNGTNLVGAEREMREEIENWNLEQIGGFLSQRHIEWGFNPPAASHFGGVWERLIRSVRKVLFSLMHSQVIRLDDEGLQTLFCEVEAILNGRPLTEVSDSVNDLQVLTPNHLLLLRPGEFCPPGFFDKTDCYVRRRWRQIQYLANIFWSRWVREYLPLLQTRQKWNKSVRNVRLGDVVLLVENSPRNSWSLGRIIDVVKDKGNMGRRVVGRGAYRVLQGRFGRFLLLINRSGEMAEGLNVNMSDIEIEDLDPAQDIVSFENIKPTYSPGEDIKVLYSLGEEFSPSKRDWVGVFRTGWQTVQNYHGFEWAPKWPSSNEPKNKRSVLFPAYLFEENEDIGATYQLLYVSRGDHVAGVSREFCISCAPSDEYLGLELLENLFEAQEPQLSEKQIKPKTTPPVSEKTTPPISEKTTPPVSEKKVVHGAPLVSENQTSKSDLLDTFEIVTESETPAPVKTRNVKEKIITIVKDHTSLSGNFAAQNWEDTLHIVNTHSVVQEYCTNKELRVVPCNSPIPIFDVTTNTQADTNSVRLFRVVTLPALEYPARLPLTCGPVCMADIWVDTPPNCPGCTVAKTLLADLRKDIRYSELQLELARQQLRQSTVGTLKKPSVEQGTSTDQRESTPGREKKILLGHKKKLGFQNMSLKKKVSFLQDASCSIPDRRNLSPVDWVGPISCKKGKLINVGFTHDADDSVCSGEWKVCQSKRKDRLQNTITRQEKLIEELNQKVQKEESTVRAQDIKLTELHRELGNEREACRKYQEKIDEMGAKIRALLHERAKSMTNGWRQFARQVHNSETQCCPQGANTTDSVPVQETSSNQSVSPKSPSAKVKQAASAKTYSKKSDSAKSPPKQPVSRQAPADTTVSDQPKASVMQTGSNAENALGVVAKLTSSVQGILGMCPTCGIRFSKKAHHNAIQEHLMYHARYD
ncbi:hypothetical protein ScPMuIL_013180 [Solemya velum]